MKTLVLASTSPFRRQLLEKFNLPFECAKPDIDETPHPNEKPEQLVARLSEQKALAVSKEYQQAVIIGSDQVAVLGDQILGKPHTVANARQQLLSFSQQKVTFLTGLCVIDSDSKKKLTIVEPFDVYFKALTEQEVDAYIAAEMPLNCAGSFKSEGLGICLFEKLSGDDPNSLIGLPLIKLANLLKQQDIDVLAEQKENQLPY
jgi:MAF protein